MFRIMTTTLKLYSTQIHITLTSVMSWAEDAPLPSPNHSIITLPSQRPRTDYQSFHRLTLRELYLFLPPRTVTQSLACPGVNAL